MKLVRFEKRLRIISAVLAGWCGILIGLSVIALVYQNTTDYQDSNCGATLVAIPLLNIIPIISLLTVALFLIVAYMGYNGRFVGDGKVQYWMMKTASLKTIHTFIIACFCMMVGLFFASFAFGVYSTECTCSVCITTLLQDLLNHFLLVGFSLFSLVNSRKYKRELIKRECFQNSAANPQGAVL